MNGTKILSIIDKNRLAKFNLLSYNSKQQLKISNPTKYATLIHLSEQQYENNKIISHLQYRKSVNQYNKKLIDSINPAFFITIKYIDQIATSPERVIKLFEQIKYEIQRTRPYKFVHYIEQGQDKSYHSHVFVSSIKHKQKHTQIDWLKAKLNEYAETNRFSIATGSEDNPSILVEIFEQADWNRPNTRSHYCSKTTHRQYLSLDIENSYLPKC
jgi:hypothetical protein